MCIYIALYIYMQILFPLLHNFSDRLWILIPSGFAGAAGSPHQNSGSPLLAARNLSTARKIGVKQLTMIIMDACVIVA